MESCDKINKRHTDVTPPAVHVGVKQIGEFLPGEQQSSSVRKIQAEHGGDCRTKGTISLLHCSTSVDSSRSQIPQHCSNACKAGDGFASSDA